MKTLLVLFAFAISLAESAFAQVGRENGNNPVPLFVSHIPGANRAMLRRREAPHHNIFNKIICFEIKCRRVIGWQKRQVGMSFEKFKKEIRKNAKKGAYKSQQPKPVRKDSTPGNIKKDTTTVTKVLPVPAISGPPMMKNDSLIILNENEVLFETNSFKLQSEHLASLDSIASFLMTHPQLGVEISGHTDSIGTEMHNLRLSTQRAEAVAQYVTNKGISTDRVGFEGFGSSRPITSNGSEEGRRKNRRVEILIHNKR